MQTKSEPPDGESDGSYKKCAFFGIKRDGAQTKRRPANSAGKILFERDGLFGGERE